MEADQSRSVPDPNFESTAGPRSPGPRGRTSARRPRNAKRPLSKSATICRTCGRCRLKKIKCDGNRPTCASCRSTNHYCTYSEDARKVSRPTKAEVEALRNEVAGFRQLLRDHPAQDLDGGTMGDQRESTQETICGATAPGPLTPRGGDVRDIPPPSFNTLPHSFSAYSPRSKDFNGMDGPSSAETQVACAVEEDGSIQVHGATSHLRHPSMTQNIDAQNLVTQKEQDEQILLVKDQLFANAALQRQREATIFGSPARRLESRIELDGLDVDLAIHLLDIHFNRQHFAYLLTYRPAIIDSLTNDGPYANKLLLNAIYYSSCLYSDRTIFRANPDDPDSMGETFYLRFKELLVHEIDRSSLPTIAALLICGSTLVSNGKQSAGWVLCGTAYRMVIDLGCHLSIPVRDKAVVTSKRTAIETELRTRIYWGAYLLDKFQSLYLGRPSALRPAEARASRALLDYYEELENWSPYVDPLATPTKTHLAGFQGPRPVYAISTFQSLIPLGDIAHSVATIFYAIDSVRMSADQLLKAKDEVQTALNAWLEELPEHLRFNPATDSTPPPNQITPHVTYNTLIILLERPFLENGHLSFASDPSSREVSEARCVDAAISIWHIVDAYKRAFTLRRSPYFLAYATYSAIVVMLHQPNSNNQYEECVRFFWFALLEFQKGCTSGLRKPLRILQSLMQRLGLSIPMLEKGKTALQAHAVSQSQPDLTDHDPAEGDGRTDVGGEALANFGFEDLPDLDWLMQQNIDMDETWKNENWMASVMEDQRVLDDSLFGLFTPGQPGLQQFVPRQWEIIDIS